MGWYRRCKFTPDAFSKLASKIVPKTRINQRPTSRITRFFNPIPPTTFNINPWRPSTSRIGFWRNSLGLRSAGHNWPFTGSSMITRRSYSVGKYHRDREYYRKWIKTPRGLFVTVVIGSSIVACVVYGSYETVPYTNRNHFVILTKRYEREMGEKKFQETKERYKYRVLAEKHPESVRVRLIAKKIIATLLRELKKEEPGDYGSLEALSSDDGEEEEIELVHDDGYDKGKKKKKKSGRGAAGHLEGVKWEVIVVDKPNIVNAFCLPGGKIVVFTGLLKQFQSDSEIAAIIGHEVGHVVARHSTEEITKYAMITVLQFILSQDARHHEVAATITEFILLPFSRKNELEADYIGLLLMASAGYDPRVAPGVYNKLDGDDKSLLGDYLSTHPSGKKRAKLLAKAKVMEEAVARYHEFMALAAESE